MTHQEAAVAHSLAMARLTLPPTGFYGGQLDPMGNPTLQLPHTDGLPVPNHLPFTGLYHTGLPAAPPYSNTGLW